MPRLAALALVLASPLGACVADTEDLRLRGRDAGVIRADAAPREDGGGTGDARPDAGPCDPTSAPLDLAAGRVVIVDIAPTSDRVLAGDGVTINVFALPGGDFVASHRGVSAAFGPQGRSLVVDVGAGELRFIDEGGSVARLNSDSACRHQLTPNRRYSIAVSGCRSVFGDREVGRLEVVDLLTGALTVADDRVVADSLVVSAGRDDPPRLAYLRSPQGTSCSRCPTLDAQAIEVLLVDSAALPPPSARRIVQLRGFTPGATALLGFDAACSCADEPPVGVVDVRASLPLIDAVSPSFRTRDPLDSHGVSALAVVPTAHGDEGILAFPTGGRELVYRPYEDSRVPQVLMIRVVPSPVALLRSGGRDIAAIALDDSGRLVRIPIATSLGAEVLVPGLGLGVSDLLVSDDRETAAFVVDSGGQVTVSELFIVPATGAVLPMLVSSWPIDLRGFIPSRRGVLALVEEGTLTRFVPGESPVELDKDVDRGGPVVTDARGCWVAHRGATTGGLRVVPIPE